MRVTLIVLAFVFLIAGALGILVHALSPSYEQASAPVASIALLVLGTGCVVSLAQNRR